MNNNKIRREQVATSPAERVGAADVSQLQTRGFVALLVRAGRDDGATAALGTGLVGAGAEEQGVTELPGNPLEELTQRLRKRRNSQCYRFFT